MTTPSRRPWHDLYKSVPLSIAPASETALQMFQKTLDRTPDAPLVHYFDQSITAAQFDAWSDALAADLQAREVMYGDRIAMYLQNIPQVMTVILLLPVDPPPRRRRLLRQSRRRA